MKTLNVCRLANRLPVVVGSLPDVQALLFYAERGLGRAIELNREDSDGVREAVESHLHTCVMHVAELRGLVELWEEEMEVLRDADQR